MMKKSKFFILCAILACLFFSIFIVLKKKNENIQNNEVVKIGILLPLTGELSSFGIPIHNGIKFAISEVDQSKYNFIIIDSQNKKVTALNAVNKLISVDKVKYIIGDISTTITMAIEPICTKNKVFLFSPTTQSPEMSNISPFFARNYPTTDQEAIDAAEYVIKKFNNKKISVVYVEDPYGQSLAKKFREEIQKANNNLCLYEGFESNQKDFQGILAKLNDIKPDVIYLAANQKEMGVFMKQFGSYGLSSQIISNIAFLEDDCLKYAGKAAEGAIVPVTYYDPKDSQNSKKMLEFAQKYNDKTGNYPTIAESIGYDTLKILIYALENSPKQDVQDVAAFVRNLKRYEGATGTLDFTNGDVTLPMVLKQIQNGEAVIINK